MRKEDGIPRPDAGIYIHFPFCKKKCFYCDFYSLEKEIPAPYLDALFSEIDLYAHLFQDFTFTTLYLGGGTPSLLTARELSALFKKLESAHLLDNLLEITLEANPESLSPPLIAMARSLGVNRLSLGTQSMNDAILSKIGRLADRKTNLNAIGLARDAFPLLNLDLIYGIPGQDYLSDLQDLLDFSPEHLSPYCLTIAPHTPLFEHHKDFTLPDESLNTQFETLHDVLTRQNYRHYEISNYALPGKESLHNLHYWQRRPYLGLGAGASGFLGKRRYTNVSLPLYYEYLANKKFPYCEEETLSPQDEIQETLLLGLRTIRGISEALFEAHPFLAPQTKEFLAQGWLLRQKGSIIPTLKGWEMLDFMLRGWWNTFP